MKSIISRFKVGGAANATGGVVRPNFPRVTLPIAAGAAGAGYGLTNNAAPEVKQTMSIAIIAAAALGLIILLGD